MNMEKGSGSISIGSMSGGSLNTGDNGTATSFNTTSGAATGQEYQELLAAIRNLRHVLPSVDRSADDAALDTELGQAEDEIARTGATDRTRLTNLLSRVQRWLGTGAKTAAAVASVTVVVQGITHLLAAT